MITELSDFRKRCLQTALENYKNLTEDEKSFDMDLYGTYPVMFLMNDERIQESNRLLRRTAMYMDLPHPAGRDVRGENDFAGLRCVIALNLVEDKLETETKELIKRFLLERDFASMYGSENHAMMKHVIRLLAAEHYGEPFKQYGLTAEEAFALDKAYLLDFMRFRAQYGMGEFTSIYLGVDMFMAGLLVNYVKDPEIKNMAQMFLDLLFLEMTNNRDPYGSVAGAMGRVYPGVRFYGHDFCMGGYRLLVQKHPTASGEYVLAPYDPSPYITEIVKNRAFPCEVRERKHLHSMSAWMPDQADKAQLDKLLAAGGIDKFTYLSEDYCLGGIIRQDDYPVDETEDYVYAHHQQIEWSLVLPDADTSKGTKIFSGHPGTSGEHNQWTGDLRCCCVKTYADKNTVLTFYNVKKKDELPYTHVFLEAEKFDDIEWEPQQLFLKKGRTFIFIKTFRPYAYRAEDNELKCEGRQNAYIVRVATTDEFADFAAFINAMKALPAAFDPETMTLTFDGLTLNETDKPAHYETVYDAPWCHSLWNDGVITVKGKDKNYQLDFLKNEVRVCEK